MGADSSRSLPKMGKKEPPNFRMVQKMHPSFGSTRSGTKIRPKVAQFDKQNRTMIWLFEDLFVVQNDDTPLKPSMEPENIPWKRRNIYIQKPILGFHVCFLVCMSSYVFTRQK